MFLRQRAAAKGPLYLLGSAFHIPAVEASPMPKPVASSSKRLAPADDDSDVEMPAPSKKSRLQEVEVLVSSPPRPTARARKASPAASSSRKDAPPLRTSVAPLVRLSLFLFLGTFDDDLHSLPNAAPLGNPPQLRPLRRNLPPPPLLVKKYWKLCFPTLPGVSA